MKAIGLIFAAVAALVIGVEATTGKSNNSSLSLILGDQCVTRDEVQVIRDEMEQAVNSELQAIRNELQATQNTLQTVRNEFTSIVQSQMEMLANKVQQNAAQLLTSINAGNRSNSVSSCQNIPQGKPSGVYWIQGLDGSASQQYCDMTRTCCGRTGGWMKVADIDMNDDSRQSVCPSEFRLVTSPRRSCGRPGPAGCVSTTFPVRGVEYTSVCGRIIGYQSGTPDAFWSYYYHAPSWTIDNNYVDGISLTYGRSPRKHIWTFAAARDETRSDEFVCPCTRSDRTYTGTVPPFIGQDYFCETGSRGGAQDSSVYPGDPLWNGRGCGSRSTCCSFNNPPWFCKQLPQPTREDIELRMCSNNPISKEDTPFEIVEIYVQ